MSKHSENAQVNSAAGHSGSAAVAEPSTGGRAELSGGAAAASGGAGALATDAGVSAEQACNLSTPDDARIAWTTLGWRLGDYEGPAVVERSSSQDLVLYVEGKTSDADGGVDDAISGARCVITSTRTLPLLQPTAKVWLHADAGQSYEVSVALSGVDTQFVLSKKP